MASDELERKALDYDCPACRVVPGAPCRRQGYQATDWPRPALKHPHPERVASAREDAADQGGGSW